MTIRLALAKGLVGYFCGYNGVFRNNSNRPIVFFGTYNYFILK